MIYDEGKRFQNGEVLPIECLRIQYDTVHRKPDNLHYHDYTELLFGLTGSARVYIGNQSAELTPGTLIVIQAGDAHVVSCVKPPNEYIVVKFLPQMLISAEQTGAEFGYALTLMEQAPDRQTVFSPQELCQTEIPSILHHMIAEWEERRFGYELSLRADVTRIFLFLLRHWQANGTWLRERILPADRTVMQTALSYIGTHYAELSEREVADVCGVSPTAFSRLFARVMRTSFPSYVCGIRIREAERLLLTTDRSVTDIAMQVGFSTPAYFIVKFRESKGITPHQFRSASRGV